MGITIHYRLIADDPKTVITAIKIVEEEAEKAGYRYEVYTATPESTRRAENPP